MQQTHPTLIRERTLFLIASIGVAMLIGAQILPRVAERLPTLIDRPPAPIERGLLR